MLGRVKGNLGKGLKKGKGLFNIKQTEVFMEKNLWEDHD